ncbi:MAG: LPXTG cell wall anchor domain-containing protein, partial [Firmicutes bacterium]|nr:LPXTG cell wall anchor domain-containing protein [Bacillota bacterium]
EDKTPTTPGGDVEKPEAKPEAPKEEAKTEAPATGDTNSVLPMAVLMVAAGATFVVANKKREEEK